MPYVSESDGRIHASKLEYNVVDHCNLACRECSHLSPYLRAHALPLETFARDLACLAQVYRVQRLRFVGGEPLLNRDLGGFVAAARASGIARDIEVVTNGVLLARIPDELLAAIDSLAISCYPDHSPSEDLLDQTRAKCRQHGVSIKVERIDRFRNTQTALPIDDPKLLDGVFKSCLIAHTWSCQTIYDGRFYLCSRPLYTDTFLTGIGQSPIGFKHADGIALHEPRLLERLREYLGSSTPLKSCQYCLGTVGRYQPHGQLTSRERWKPTAPAGTPSQRVDIARMRYLLRWQKVSASLLRRIPSRRLSRLLAVTQTALIGD